MFNARAFRIAGSTALLAALAGCQAISAPPMRGGVGAPQAQSSLDGDWINMSDQASYSRFMGGQVETVALDTGNTLATGSYTMTDQSNVSISMTSLIRQNQVQFNCLVVTTAQLNCTSASGQQFSLVRRSGNVS